MWQHVTILPGITRRHGLAVEPWVLVDCMFGLARSHETTSCRGYGRSRLLGLCSEEHWHGMEELTLRRPSATNAVWVPKSQTCLWMGGGPYFDGGPRPWTQCGYWSPFQNPGQGAMAIQGWARHPLSRKRLMRKGRHGLLGALELKDARTHGVTET